MNSARKTLLVISGGTETVEGIRQIREDLGSRIVVSDGNPKAPGLALADHALIANPYDPEETLSAVRGFLGGKGGRIDGVLCLACDAPHTAAAVTAALGLPGISPAAARAATDKLLMKEKLSAAGVRIPWFAAAPDAASLPALVADRLPVIVKPVDSRGARGVTLIRRAEDLPHAWHLAAEQSPSGRVMTEAYLDGPQLSTEGLVIEGSCHNAGYADRNYSRLEQFAPHVIEDGGELPSRLAPPVLADADEQLGRAARALGISFGPLKGDVVIHRGRAHIIEVAARLSGGYLCTYEIPISYGVPLVPLAARQALGERIDPKALRPRPGPGTCQRFVFPAAGRVIAMEGIEAVRARDDCILCESRFAVGDIIPPLASHVGRAAVVIMRGHDREDAVRRANEAAASIRIETAAP